MPCRIVVLIGGLLCAATTATAFAQSAPPSTAELLKATTPSKAATALLGPPVVIDGGPQIGYMAWIRTVEPVDENIPGRDIIVAVPSLKLEASVKKTATPPTRSAKGGWCVRVELGRGTHRRGWASARPRAVTMRLSSTDGLRQEALARFQVDSDSAATSAIPKPSSGCGKRNFGGVG